MRGCGHPLWVDDAPPAAVTPVLLHGDLPGPAIRNGFPAPHNPCVALYGFDRWAPTSAIITLKEQKSIDHITKTNGL